jgi:hypothetical protein
MNPMTLRNLTMASAKHLLTTGHINKAHHAKIMSKVKVAGAPAPPKMMASKPMKSPPMGAPGPVVDEGVSPQAVPMGALDAAQGRGAAPMTPMDE